MAGARKELTENRSLKLQHSNALANSQRALDMLLQGSTSSLALLDPEFNIIRVNEAYAQAHGKPEAFFRGQNHFDLYSSDARQPFEKARSSGEPVTFAARPGAVPGRFETETSYWDCTLVPIHNQQAELEALILTETEVTGRVNTEKTLYKASKILAAIQHAQQTSDSSAGPRELLDKLLTEVIDLTESDYGFIGQVASDVDALTFIDIQTIINFTPEGRDRAFSVAGESRRLDLAGPESLLGEVILKHKTIVSNDPAGEARDDGLPEGHPRLRSVLAMPFSAGGKLTGALCVANCPDGYSSFLAESLQPLLHCYEQLLGAAVSRGEMREAMEALEQNQNLIRDLAVPAVESEHDELIGLINDCYEEILEGADIETIQQLLANIQSSTREHFLHEEQLMRSARYPDYEAHKASHDRLLTTLQQNIDRFNQDPDQGAHQLQRTLAGWFGRHFSTHDQQLNTYLAG